MPPDRTRTALALLLLGFLTLACDATGAGRATAPQPTSTETASQLATAAVNRADVRAAIDAMNASLVTAMLSGDAAAAAAHYTPDAVVMFPGMEQIVGRASVERAFAALFAAVDYTDISVSSQEVIVSGDRAIEVGTTRFVFEAGGQVLTDRGQYLVVWRRLPGGEWRIDREATNSRGS